MKYSDINVHLWNQGQTIISIKRNLNEIEVVCSAMNCNEWLK